MIFTKNKSFDILIFLSSCSLLIITYLLKTSFNVKALYYLQLVFSSIVLGSFVLLILNKRLSIKIKPKTSRKILIYSVLFYTTFFSLLTILRYLSFTSNVLDLGTFLQPLSNTMRGHLMEYTSMNSPFEGRCRFGNHFELIYLPLSLFVHFFKGPYFYLILQTLFLSTSAFPLYRIGLRITKKIEVALAISLSYLFYTGLHYLNLFDIHGDAFAILFIFWLTMHYLGVEKNIGFI